ncbi:MAG: hypothetical protein Q9M09_04285 [Mariprofundaceae bacterium]|nr:hypothetical protein [Mariprofundaceae bacterium]
MADCYCEERLSDPELAAVMEEIPEGYCGLCDTCGKPGHTRAHPHAPVTSAWCDAHWDEMQQHRIISLAEVIPWLFLLLLLTILSVTLYSLF